MTASQSSGGNRSSRKPLLVLAIVYAAVLVAVAATMQFSAEAEATKFLQQQMQAAPVPLEPLPKPFAPHWPNIAVSMAATADTPAAQPKGESAGTRFLARFREGDKPYLVARRTDGSLARFGIGDSVDDATITRIGGGQVTLDAQGKPRNVAIRPEVE